MELASTAARDFAVSSTGWERSTVACSSTIGPEREPASAQRFQRVVIADDSALLRQGLARLLDDAGVEVAGQVADAPDLLAITEAEGKHQVAMESCEAMSGTEQEACKARADEELAAAKQRAESLKPQ